MNECEDFNSLTIRDLCRLLAQKNPLWNDVLAHTHPRPRCPFNTTALQIVNATMDFGYFGYMPIGGYNWISIFKLFKSIANVRHKKHLLFCLMFESSAIKTEREVKIRGKEEERRAKELKIIDRNI